MPVISNIKIGRKIALVLGCNVLLLAGLSALSLWGLRISERLAEDSVSRVTKEKLAEAIAGRTATIAQNIGQMMLAKQPIDDLMFHILDLRGTRMAALQEFTQTEKTPKGVQHSAQMAQLLADATAADNNIVMALNDGKYADALQALAVSSSVNARLGAKAKEASEWQGILVAENEKRRKVTSRNLWIALIAGSLLAAAAAVFGGIVLARGIARPLAVGASHLDRIAQGDLSQDTPAELQGRGDEVGILARAMQTMTLALRQMIQEISGGIQVLAVSSNEMMTSSTEMTSGSRHTSDKAHSVSAAAEELSSNISSVAAGMEHTSMNLAHISSATGQMTSTINEIAQNSEKARRITDEANRQAARINGQIKQLGVAAREIGKVTETITEISSQTNLLALNATIEAARAGSAGKGFAVVATEIKALAQQTAAATEDIKGKIAGVQSATEGGITEIEKISEVILGVSNIVTSIAAAIEQQSASTSDIARNIAEASNGMSEVNSRVSETSQVSREIAKDVVSVDETAGDMAQGSDHVRDCAVKLFSIADELKLTISRFRLTQELEVPAESRA